MPVRHKFGLRLVDVVIVTLVASHWALEVSANNFWQIAHPERVIVTMAVTSLFGLLAALLSARFGGSRRAAVLAVLAALVFLTRGGPLTWEFGAAVASIGFGIVVSLIYVLARRLDMSPVVSVLTVALTVSLVSGPVLAAYSTITQMGDDVVQDRSFPGVEMTVKPDIYLVVVDSRPGRLALVQEFGLDQSDFIEALRSAGLEVPKSVWTSYWTTERSIPAILEMGYPTDGEDLSPVSRRTLQTIVSGENHLLETLTSNGYRTTMIESGWVGSSCGSQFDDCVSSVWLDEFNFAIYFESALSRNLLFSGGHPFSVGTRHSMDSLRTQVERARGNQSPDFVFAHLMAPHGPFFLDESCEITVTESSIAASASTPDIEDPASEYFLQQMGCVDSFMLEIAEVTSADDVVVFVSDHGMDEHMDIFNSLDRDEDSVVERMNAFLAVRVQQQCDVGDEMVTVNLMRRVLSCYASDPVPDLEERMFLPGGGEVTDEDLRSLMGQATIELLGDE